MSLGHNSTRGVDVHVKASTWAETLARPARKRSQFEGKVSAKCAAGKHRSHCVNRHCVCPCHRGGV
jgi:hypothetical protein